PFRPVLASYAVAVALNSFLPANIGSLVMLVMFTTLIASATFAAVLSGFIVQKITFSVLNVAAYLYLFATVAGSLSIKLGFLAKHPVASALIALGAVVLLLLLARFFWARATKLREQVKTGGDPRSATTVPDRRRPSRVRKLTGAAGDRRGVHGRVLDPGQLP